MLGFKSPRRLRETQAAVAEGVTAGIYSGHATDTSRMHFASPFSTSNLERWAYQDMFGDLPLNTRENALSIPAVLRARTKVVTAAAKLPLVLIDPSKIIYTHNAETGELDQDISAAILPDQPRWLTQCGDGSSPQLRMAWTVDDLIHYGLSLWWRNDSGTPEETRQRINWDEWEIDTDRREILVNGSSADPSEVVLFCGFHEGILFHGRQAILDALMLYRNVRQRIKNPVPITELHQTGGTPLNSVKRKELLDEYRAARQDPDGAVSFTSQYLEIKTPGADVNDSALMIEARNAMAVDAARLVGVPAGVLDATTPKASLNYETQTGRNEELLEDLDTYLEPIMARLSLDDSTGPGTAIVFNRNQFTTLKPSPLGQPVSD